MPPVNTHKAKKRPQPYPTKCKEETCDEESHRETGCCHDRTLEHGQGLIHELLMANAGKDSKDLDLLSLSAYIAIKVQLTDISNKDRKKFAALFRNIALKVENKDFSNVSSWMLFGIRKRIPKDRKVDENV
jgi:hypothetical protein